ncbi:MAG TPA: tetratricopeptide repeat protein [Gemmatimonadales bacterium]|nr:tetratricopeptide repeat protein [Gemmatimonadales bacterium]
MKPQFLPLLLGAAVACARAPQPAPLTPLRVAASLAAAGRCDSATVVARTALESEPDNVLGPLVIGGCQERAGRYDEAVATYNDFAAQHPNARGVAAVRAKAQLALRAAAERTARQALAREAQLALQPPQPATVAVLPLVIAGDSSVQPLSRGLAELITTDLAYLRTLRLLERLQIGMLMDELKLGRTERMDPATAARVGRLLRAERMVQGTATIPRRGPVQLSATVVTGSGVVRPVSQVTGPFAKLLDLEKQVVLELAAQLGLQLTQAEREQILRQGPKSLAAFLAYSRGLEAMDRGDYGAAARHFRSAAQADRSFQAAHDGQQAATAAPALEPATGGEIFDVVRAVDVVERATGVVEPADLGGAGGVLSAGARDVVPAIGDAIAQIRLPTGSSTIDRHLTPESLGLPSIVSVVNGITIIFKRPP